ncbi:hypothetical protein MAPG_08065 [Magnaporthiopsis poae ATCC 64411]|uniref:CrcB-like protein n=1 Tax=Magnaporthiopsis poae (strain ATCC 64411 / 73-15) TaxID=644358 RepID=A0A0C4E6D1_MAGP6|nr:hypothetical protein MAPG_08065 [Magnaporthiopsis poae ATCC 64411]
MPIFGRPWPAAVAQAVAAEAYTVSYLVLFALLGTLARLALQALTSYSGAPVGFVSVWPNFAGSFVFGLVAHDRVLPRRPGGLSATTAVGEPSSSSDNSVSGPESSALRQPGGIGAMTTTTTPAPGKTKKTPLYVGLTTGFCGSFTSFSSFIRDAFLALVNGLAPPGLSNSNNNGANGGQSFMAFLAVILIAVSLSLAGLFSGAHLAQAALKPTAAFARVRSVLDRTVMVLAWSSWLVVAVVAATTTAPGLVSDAWLRGQVLLALAFAPLGCLARFYLSTALNGRLSPSFPLGTFVANVAGTAMLAVAWDLAHARLGGVVGCLVLQGVEDGFCGCLTTVSTWVAELAELARRRTRDAYVYGASSIAVALLLAIAIMGGLVWSHGGDLRPYCIY